MARTPKYPGLSSRLKQRLRQLGYVRADRTVDVFRFCRECAHTPQNVYAWLQDRAPDKYLERLIKDLGVTKSWLCFGEGDPPVAVKR